MAAARSRCSPAASAFGLEPRLPGRVPKGIDYELRKLHYDVALAAFKPSLAALFAYIPMSQILLGSDYPFSSIEKSITGLEEMRLAARSRRDLMAGMRSG